MTASAAWLVGGLVLAGLEMVVPGAFLIWIGLAALGTGMVALGGMALHWQVAVFVVLAAGSIGLVARRLRPAVDRVNAPGAGLVGQVCHAVAFADGEGRVALGDGQWQARLVAPGAVVPGAALRVVGVEGTVLVVETPTTAVPAGTSPRT